MATDLVRIEGLESVLKTLRELPAEVVSKNGGPVRAALRKGAVIIQNRRWPMCRRSSIRRTSMDVSVSNRPGKKSIRIKRVRPLNKQRGEAFIVSVRSQRYPNRTIQRKGPQRGGPENQRRAVHAGGGDRTQKGDARMRPAFEAKRARRCRCLNHGLPRAIDRAVKKLAKRNGART